MLSGLELIKSYRANPDKYYPMAYHMEEVPGRNEYGEVNIGWNAGLLDKKRPFFVECWAVDQMTMLTVYFSTKKIEDMSAEELDRWLQDVGYYSNRNENHLVPTVNKFKKPDGDEFFSINIGVGIEDEPAWINGAPVIPWNVLNEYNRETLG